MVRMPRTACSGHRKSIVTHSNARKRSAPYKPRGSKLFPGTYIGPELALSLAPACQSARSNTDRSAFLHPGSKFKVVMCHGRAGSEIGDCHPRSNGPGHFLAVAHRKRQQTLSALPLHQCSRALVNRGVPVKSVEDIKQLRNLSPGSPHRFECGLNP